MIIIIDNKQVALPDDFEFEYISENRLFTEADDYSLSITLPLAGCPANTDIFSHINRADVNTDKLLFDCEIIAGTFRKSGAVTVTDINEVDVTVQFLAGRSVQNFDETLDDIFINELPLDMGVTSVSKLTSSVEDAWDPDYTDRKCVALPWVNNSSGNIQNCFVENKDGSRSWHENTENLSWHPYLLEVTRAILETIGYSYDLSKWENHQYLKWLLMCNTLPAAWGIESFARALPHWSVIEYFEKLELLLGVEFEFNHKDKHVSMTFLNKQSMNSGPVINIEDIVAEHSAEVSTSDPDCDYRGAKNIVFSDRDDETWKYESCNRVSDLAHFGLETFPTFSELLSAAKAVREWDGFYYRNDVRNMLLYAEDVDAYFVLRAIDKQWYSLDEPPEDVLKSQILPCRYTLALQPVNQLGGRIVDSSDDASREVIDFIPVRKDYTDNIFGRMMFLSPASYNEDLEQESQGKIILWGKKDLEEYCMKVNSEFRQTTIAAAIEQGEPDNPTEYYSKIYVGFWNGTKRAGFINPIPSTAIIEPNDVETVIRYQYSLNPGSEKSVSSGAYVDIDNRIKYTFQFLAEDIPDVRAIFIIRGKRYLCERLTAKFTNDGMSQLIKGEFYRFNN